MRRLFTATATVIVIATLTAMVANAAEPDARVEAQRRLDEGSQLYRRGDYEAALRAFTEARTLYPSPKLYFNIGQTLSRLGRPAEAADAFERFLAEATDAAPARRRDAEAFLVDLRPQIGRLRITAPAGATVTIDGQPTGTTPLPRPVPLAPGTHQIQLSLPAAPAPSLHTVEIAKGETTDWSPPPASLLSPALGAAPSPDLPGSAAGAPALPSAPPDAPPSAMLQAPPPAPAPLWRRWWPWAIAGAVVAGLTTALLVSPRHDPAPVGTLGFADGRH